MKKVKLTEEYKNYYDQYVAKYGRVVILLQCGSFMEFYCNEDDATLFPVVMEAASLINCKITFKNSKRNDGTMLAGFPLNSLEKNVARLVENDYTVVIIEQSGSVDGKDRLSRQVTRIVSKGTADSGRLRTNVMSIYYRKHGKNLYTFGISVFDTNLSQDVVVHEIRSHPEDKGFALDTVIRFVAHYDPVECVLATKWGDSTQDLIRHLDIKCNVIQRDVESIEQSILEEIRKESVSDPILYSVSALKSFLREHNCDTDGIRLVYHVPEKHLDLCSTAIKQLDLYRLFDRREIFKTCTPMGRRLLLDRILNPSVDPTELEMRYDAIDRMKEDRATELKTILSGVTDLDKTHQKLSVGKLTWGQFRVLYAVYTRVLGILDAASKTELDAMLAECNDTVRLKENVSLDGGTSEDEVVDDKEDMVKVDTEAVLEVDTEIDTEVDTEAGTDVMMNIFQTRVHPDLDELIESVVESKRYLDTFVDNAIKLVPKCNSFKIKDRSGIVTTHKRAEMLQKGIVGCKVIKMQGSSVVYTEQFRNHLFVVSDINEQIKKLTETHFATFQKNLWYKWKDTLIRVVSTLAELDVQQTSYVMKTKFRLTRPTLTTEQTLDIQGLRHLLIELINPDVRYIPNDCELVTSNSPHSGMLLYGVNSCGKTSYLKAVGMSVVLAQAGLFVPASGMKFRPFSKIMTRIAGGDNMERSQSSYIVELDELLSVIQRSDDRTLVLGDEMCRGTEVESANAMVYSVLKWLVERKTLFISATHLHDIVPEVERNLGDRISIFHMTVTFEDDQVFYDRVLVKGAGPRLYGLEIAKAMNFPDSFMRRALDFRISHVQPSQQQQQSPQQQKERSPPKTSRSRYNSKKILVRCEACGYRPNSSRCMPLDTHHIEFQCNADSDGYHGTQNKNALHNLVCLCKECHVRVHRGTLSIKTLQTLKGTKYKFEEITDRNPRSCDVR